jgi:hypothetical protein
MGAKKRFAVGAKVRVKNPGINGVVKQADDEPTSLGEYWHTIQTVHGESPEPGCNLELVPKPQGLDDASASKGNAGTGKLPFQWEVMHFADIGASEEFVQQLMLEMADLINGTIIPEPKREEVKHAIMTISVEGLMPAFEHLKRIRASVIQQMPVLNRKQLYEDFTRVLWHGYKDLMQIAASLLGANIGFLFQNDPNFEKGLAEFKVAHPAVLPWFGDHLRTQRTNWQNKLADFRNHFLEHRQEEPEKINDFYQPSIAEALFDSVWRTTADILVTLLVMHLPPGVGLVEIPVAERTGQAPRRFRFVIPSLREVS